MRYYHKNIDGSKIDLPVGKVVCVARNYVEHIKELDNPVPTEPIFFIKPTTALQAITTPITIPEYSQSCHHETELTVLFGGALKNASPQDVEHSIAGYGIGLDLTLRDVQQKLKEKGHPWEIAKGFDGSCPMSPFVGKSAIETPQDVQLRLDVNGETRQNDSTRLMITGIVELVVAVSRYFTLNPGDLLMTGTPAGVAELRSGDELELTLDNTYCFKTTVA